MTGSRSNLEAFIILAGLFAIVGCLAYSLLLGYVKRQETLRQQEHELSSARIRVELELRQERQEIERRRLEQSEGEEDLVARSLRMEKILTSLDFKTLSPPTKSASNDNGTLSIRNLQQQDVVRQGSSNNATTAILSQLFGLSKTEDSLECCICLEPYKDGQVVCCAKKSQCEHIFHEACALQWLQHHDQCPLCRISLIQEYT